MAKAKQIAKAKKLLKQYEELTELQRYYENENWHCVDVKRGIEKDLDDVIHFYAKQYHKAIKDEFDDEKIGGEYGIYQHWIEYAWEDLNEGLKDCNLKLDFIKDDYKWAENKIILSLGRSGGWACFQDTQGDDLVENLESIIDGTTDSWIYSDDTDGDIIQVLKDAESTIDEIIFVKDYIYKFNNGLDFGEELKYRIDEYVDQLKDEKKAERKTKKDIANAIQVLVDNNVSIKDLTNNK